MKAIVITTITSTIDIDTFDVKHTVDLNDEDGLSEVSTEVFGAVLIGALAATTKAIQKQYPRVANLSNKQDEEEADV